jgi:biopolymer transport protein ExbD
MILQTETVHSWSGAEVKKSKRKPLLIDMTPMVDLGFILITFFIYTTQLSTQVTMKLAIPKDGTPTLLPPSTSMTILIGAANKLHYYFGTEEEAFKNKTIAPSQYSVTNGIGFVIREKQLSLDHVLIDRNKLMILIKADKRSSYKNVVDILDEMLINNVKRYAIVEPGEWDKKYLAEPGH